ncbi:MAG: ABC transporter ATP-binding protein [Lachnospiraceae bacterium]|nr:ABC transporter ATP-binding protein [Lachnospiraceae bacterium]
MKRKKEERNLWIRVGILLLTGPFIIAENAMFSWLNKQVFDVLPMEQRQTFLWGIVFAVYLFLFWGIESLNNKNQIFFSKEMAGRLKEKVYRGYIKNKKFLYQKKSLSSTINYDIPMLEEEFYYAIISFCMHLGAVLLAFWITFSVNFVYGLFCFLVMGIPVLLNRKRTSSISEIRETILEEKEKYTTFLSETARGKETIRQYRLLDTVQKRHCEQTMQIAVLEAKKRKQMMASMISSQSINRLATEIASLTGFYLVSQGKLTLGWVMAFNQLASSMTFSLAAAIQRGISICSCLSIRRKIEIEYGLSQKKEEWEERREYIAERGKIGCHCCIERCMLGGKQIFNGVNFVIKPGEKVLITGENGSGKTTLLKILLGLNQEFEGRVDWIGKDGEVLKGGEGLIAYIPQNPFVFEGTVKENIVLDKEEEQERYREVKEIVSLKVEDDKKVEILQQNISGGEKQKIELARAIYSGCRAFILDEPYSALDQGTLLETEHYLLEDSEKTVIVVSHAEREETEGWYTRHLVVEDGKVWERRGEDARVRYGSAVPLYGK